MQDLIVLAADNDMMNAMKGLLRRCQDPASLELKEVLQEWFSI